MCYFHHIHCAWLQLLFHGYFVQLGCSSNIVWFWFCLLHRAVNLEVRWWKSCFRMFLRQTCKMHSSNEDQTLQKFWLVNYDSIQWSGVAVNWDKIIVTNRSNLRIKSNDWKSTCTCILVIMNTLIKLGMENFEFYINKT